MAEEVLISGGYGTIGSRLRKLLDEMKISSIVATYSGRLGYDFSGRAIRFDPTLLVDGPDLEERLEVARQAKLVIQGKLGSLSPNTLNQYDFASTTAIFDTATDKGTRFNLDSAVYPSSMPLLVQGGVKLIEGDNIVPYVSAPCSMAALLYGKKDLMWAKQVSCNTTWLATVLGLVLDGIRDYAGENIKQVDVILQRRFADPEELGKKYDHLEEVLKDAPKYTRDLTSVMPQLSGKVKVVASKMPWRHFHYGVVDVHFKEGYAFDSVRRAFEDYPRGILVQKDINQKQVEDYIARLIDAGESMGLPAGNILLPANHLEKVDEHSLRVVGYNEQRGAPLLSSLDWLWQHQGSWDKQEDWRKAFDYTNLQVSWYGLKVEEIKERMERRLNSS